MRNVILSSFILSALCCVVVADANWQVCEVHPWVDADAQQLPAFLTTEATQIDLTGPRNDWLTGAVAIASDGNSDVTVTLTVPAALENHVELRVVGQVNYDGGVVWDPLIRQIDMPAATKALNYDQIKDFPLFKVTQTIPTFLWITVDLRHIKSARYQANLHFEDNSGNTRDIPLNINVMDAELPVDSPLYYISWQWWSGTPMIRDFIEHGINVAWTNHEEAWDLGAKFLLFNFHHGGLPLDQALKDQIETELDEKWELINRLGVPNDQWALDTYDEPDDEKAALILEYDAWVKQLRPNTPLWHNPAYPSATLAGTFQAISPNTDIWCPYHYFLSNSSVYNYMKSTGKPMWAYEIWGNASRRPGVGREVLRKGPWYAWKYRLQGFGNYAANNWSVDPWEGQVDGVSNYSFVYPDGPDGRPISSRGYEAIRQGVQEYKRLYVLKQLGASPTLLDELAEQVVNTGSAESIDDVRKRLDCMLWRYQNFN